jgi:hypothetical protein
VVNTFVDFKRETRLTQVFFENQRATTCCCCIGVLAGQELSPKEDDRESLHGRWLFLYDLVETECLRLVVGTVDVY